MSANLIVDLNGTATMLPSFPGSNAPNLTSGLVPGLSGALIGDIVDLLNCNTMQQVVLQGAAVIASGPIILQVQCSDATTSGTFTDPTSGLAQLPTAFASGGQLIIGSGGGGYYGAGVSGQQVQSGFFIAAGFQRPQRYARLVYPASQTSVATIWGGFLAQTKTTGSGGGFTFSPGSGSVSV